MKAQYEVQGNFQSKALKVYISGNKTGVHNDILLRKSMEKRNCSLL